MHLSNRFKRIITLTTILAGILAMDFYGLFSPLNSYIYDQISMVNAARDTKPAKVTLVTIQASQLNNPSLLTEFHQELTKNSPSLIIYLKAPTQIDPNLLTAMTQQNQTRFLRHYVRGELGAGYQLAKQPLWLKEHAALSSVLPPITDFGISGSEIDQRRWQVEQGESIFHESLTTLNLSDDLLPDKRQYVNYLGGTARYPILTFDDVMSGNAIPEIISGQIVLIDPVSTVSADVVYSPFSRWGEIISNGQWLAFALQSIIGGEAINPLPSSIVALLLLLYLVPLVILYQILSTGYAVWAQVLLSAFLLLASFTVLVITNIWIPVVTFWLWQTIVFIYVLQNQIRADELAIQKVLFETGLLMQKRLAALADIDGDRYWRYVVTMINQTMTMNRMIFLESQKRTRYVKEVFAQGCSIDDIEEMRRDTHRKPYTEATLTNGPLKLTKAFLKDNGKNDVQFLITLRFAGEVFGYWAFSVNPMALNANPRFIENARIFADEIGELMYLRHRRKRLKPRRRDKLLQLLVMERSDRTGRELVSSTRLIEKRLDAVEQIINQLKSATVVFDMFGRVAEANESMSAIAKRLELALFDYSAIDFLIQLGNMSKEEARAILQDVLINHNTNSLPIEFETLDEQYILSISPLMARTMAISEDPEPFGLRGIMIELVEYSQINHISHLREQLYTRLNTKTREYMQRNVFATDLLESSKSSDNESQLLHTISNQAVNGALSLLEMCKPYFATNIDDPDSQAFPVEISTILNRAVENHMSHSSCEIETLFESNELQFLVMANPDKLFQLFCEIFNTLDLDLNRLEKIQIWIVKTKPRLELLIRGTGIGLPDDVLKQNLFDFVNDEATAFQPLRELLPTLSIWGGDMRVQSSVDKGISYTLKLRTFI